MKKLPTFFRYDFPVIARMMLPTLFIGAVGFHFHEFIYDAIMANKAINLGIITTALYGVVIIIFRLISMQADMSALDRFSHEARVSGDMKKLLDAEWIKGRPVRHYLEHLAHTGGTLSSQLDQDAIQNELGALSEEYNSKMELPQFLVGFMIAMGLLGTFIGLLETLTGISGMLDGMGQGGDIEKEFSKLIVELRKPLAGMGIAFSASMFGLVTSLQLSLMMIMLRRYMSRVMEKSRNVMHKLLTRIKSVDPSEAAALLAEGNGTQGGGEYAGGGQGGGGGGYGGGYGGGIPMVSPYEISAGQTSIGSETATISDKVSDAYFRSQDAIASMANGVALLSKRLDSLAKLMEVNIETTQKTNALLNFGPRMTEANENLVDEVKSFAAMQQDSHKLMQKVINSLIQIDQSLMANNTKEMTNAQRETSSTLTEMFNAEQTNIRLLSEILETAREGDREVLLALRGVQERMAKQDEVYMGTSRHLYDIKEYFAKAVSSFSLIDTVAENIGRQTLMVEASMTEERNTQKALITSIQRELREFSDSVRKITGVQRSGN